MNFVRIGARLGNWNDRVNGGDTVTTYRHPRIWRALDRVAYIITRLSGP